MFLKHIVSGSVSVFNPLAQEGTVWFKLEAFLSMYHSCFPNKTRGYSSLSICQPAIFTLPVFLLPWLLLELCRHSPSHMVQAGEWTAPILPTQGSEGTQVIESFSGKLGVVVPQRWQGRGSRLYMQEPLR